MDSGAFKHNKNKVNLETLPQAQCEISQADCEDQVELSEIVEEEVKGATWRVLRKYLHMWLGQLGRIATTEHRVRWKPGTHPEHQMPYRQGLEMREVTHKHVQEHLEAGVIEPANSEWAWPVVFAQKLDGKLSFCVDYRRFKLETLTDTYPLPRVDD